MDVRKHTAWIIALAASTGTAVPAFASEKPKTLNIGVWLLEPDRCRVAFEGREYILPDTEARLLAALKAARKSADSLHITNDMTTPWRCMGGVMTVGQRAKFKKIGFVAEPPNAIEATNVR